MLELVRLGTADTRPLSLSRHIFPARPAGLHAALLMPSRAVALRVSVTDSLGPIPGPRRSPDKTAQPAAIDPPDMGKEPEAPPTRLAPPSVPAGAETRRHRLRPPRIDQPSQPDHFARPHSERHNAPKATPSQIARLERSDALSQGPSGPFPVNGLARRRAVSRCWNPLINP